MEYKSPKIHRTPLYRAKAAYSNMKVRCLNTNGKNPSYAGVELRMSLDEWLEWSIPLYSALLEESPHQIPNAARKNDSGHYELGNIHITTQSINLQEREKPRFARNGQKCCSNCNITKELDHFSRNRSRPDGRSYWCKTCMSIKRKTLRNRSYSRPGPDF